MGKSRILSYRNVEIDIEQQNIEIMERDNGCVICGSRRNLDVHEIEPRSKFGSKRMHLCFVPENRVTLCREHHTLAHTKAMREQLKQYIEKLTSGKEQ